MKIVKNRRVNDSDLIGRRVFMKNKALILMMMVTVVSWAFLNEIRSESVLNISLASQYFGELKKISEADSGKLWGVQLYGPTIFVDAANRDVVANQPDAQNRLTKVGDIWVGNIGQDMNIANTAVEWSGVKWTMVRWDAISPGDQYDRAKLLIHESWHRVESETGVQSAVSNNTHLESGEGRVLLILEFRALKKALETTCKESQREAIGDALIFHHSRQTKYLNNNEDIFQCHEGMAEYTGLKLCGLSDSLLSKVAAMKLGMAENQDGLANSFPYTSGPAIGLLLDQFTPDWRGKIKTGAKLPELLASIVDFKFPVDSTQLAAEVEKAGFRYGADQLRADEHERVALQNWAIKKFKEKIQTQGQLIIPNNNLNFSYNPQEKLLPLDSIGVIYKTMRLSGDFGVLEVEDGIARTNDWQMFIVPAPDKIEGDSIAWDGCSIRLNARWQIAMKSKGIYTIEKR
jgi:hypothetical protein